MTATTETTQDTAAPTQPTKQDRVVSRYWSAWIQCYGPDGKTGTSCGIHGDTLADILAEAFRQGVFYAARSLQEPRRIARVMAERLEELCATCDGRKEVKYGVRVRKSKPCPGCRGGRDAMATLPDYPLVIQTDVHLMAAIKAEFSQQQAA